MTNPDGTPAPGGVPLNPDGTLAVTGIEFTVGEVAPGQPGSPSAPVPVAPVPAGSRALSRCSASDLSLSMGSDSSSNGKRKIELVFTNKSSDSCSVNGTPGVVLSGALSGSSQTLTYPVSNRVGAAKEVALKAGGKANAVLVYAEASSSRCTGGLSWKPSTVTAVAPDTTTKMSTAWKGKSFDTCGRTDRSAH